MPTNDGRLDDDSIGEWLELKHLTLFECCYLATGYDPAAAPSHFRALDFIAFEPPRPAYRAVGELAVRAVCDLHERRLTAHLPHIIWPNQMPTDIADREWTFEVLAFMKWARRQRNQPGVSLDERVMTAAFPPPPATTRGAATAERHSANREDVLLAAIALLIAQPASCKTTAGRTTNQSVADAVVEHHRLFWPALDRPPLGRKTIAELVGRYVKRAKGQGNP